MEEASYKETKAHQRRLTQWDRWRIADKISRHHKLGAVCMAFTRYQGRVFISYMAADRVPKFLATPHDDKAYSLLVLKEGMSVIVTLAHKPENPGEPQLFIDKKREGASL